MLRFRENHGSGAAICPISITYGLVMLIISRVVAIFATTLEIIREHVVANVIKRAGSRLLAQKFSGSRARTRKIEKVHHMGEEMQVKFGDFMPKNHAA